MNNDSTISHAPVELPNQIPTLVAGGSDPNPPQQKTSRTATQECDEDGGAVSKRYVASPIGLRYQHGVTGSPSVVVPVETLCSPAQFLHAQGQASLADISERMVFADIKSATGVVIKQSSQPIEMIAQTMGLPYEQQNKYHVGFLPLGKTVKTTPRDRSGWTPSQNELDAMAPYFAVSEESDWCTRMLFTALGLRYLRPLKLHFTVVGTASDVYFVNRPFHLGGCCGSPLQMDLYEANGSDKRLVGRVRERFQPFFGKWAASCCLATVYHDIERVSASSSQFEVQYTLRANTWCCGRVDNCCGATCWKNDMVFDILDTDGQVVAHLQKTFAGGKSCREFCSACGRCNYDFDNYFLEFPESSTPEDRLVLLTAVFQIDFQLFERTKNAILGNSAQRAVLEHDRRGYLRRWLGF